MTKTREWGVLTFFAPQAPACVVKLARRSSFVTAAATPSIFTLFTLFLRATEKRGSGAPPPSKKKKKKKKKLLSLFLFVGKKE
jgi:hypothetical protein